MKGMGKYTMGWLTILWLMLWGAVPSRALAGAALTDFERVGRGVSLSVVAWSEAPETPNPCYGYATCYVGPDVRYSQYGIGGLQGSCESGACSRVEDLRTLAEVAERYKNEHPLPYRATFNIDHLEDTSSCIGMSYIDRPSLAGHAILIPGSTCSIIPPDNNRCEIDMPPYIEHGTLPPNAVNGSTASVGGTAVCNYDNDVIINTSADAGKNVVYLNGASLSSRITVNNQDATDGIVLKVKANQQFPVTIKSTLMAHEIISPGAYSGSFILYINYN